MRPLNPLFLICDLLELAAHAAYIRSAGDIGLTMNVQYESPHNV
ncbi:hypothetical protein SHVI106290_18255 [Shewanella violacea]|uniref:Uncharacterized protein n=1 Tax=Shewanella violacea (strain JCM 10179 / CIP 106290 / LMG 19151 / DSS12) TaxID=637905 RepID=D4ZJP3_SHEVD|nr:hypothetical protein SVI_1921 [Shewanella violacea DSS12]